LFVLVRSTVVDSIKCSVCFPSFLFQPTVGKKENAENEISDDENQKTTPKKKG